MELRFSVGEMAKLNGLTKQMLIYYDRENVFKPKIVEKTNGYRYYTADQLEELDSILMLREMGLSLQEIKDHMQSRSGANSITVLKEQEKAVRAQIEHWSAIEKRLQHKIKSLEDFFYREDRSVKLITCEKEYLAVKKPNAPGGLVEIDIALKQLLWHASRNHFTHFYQLGDMISLENLQQKQFFSFEYAFLPIENPSHVDDLQVKPAGTFFRDYHIGSYQSMDRTYQKMLAEITGIGYKPCGYAYEYCVLDCLTTKTRDEYITEIQIQIEKANA